MRRRWQPGTRWLWILGVSLLLAVLPLSQAMGGQAKTKQPAAPVEKKVKAPSAAEKPAAAKKEAAEKEAGLVGTIVSADPSSKTLVVNVPVGKQVLTVGAWATEKTSIMAGGKKIPFGRLEQGARVRIAFRRVPSGDVLTAVRVLRGSKT